MPWSTRSFMLAVSILVSSAFFQDSLDEIIDTSFFRENRQDATLILGAETEASVLQEVAGLPGVLAVEGQQSHGVILRNGHLSKRTALDARPDHTQQYTVPELEVGFYRIRRATRPSR